MSSSVWQNARSEFLGGKSLMATRRVVDHDFISHSHEYFELEMVCSGRGTHILNGRKMSFGPGTLYLLTPEDIHALHMDEPADIFNVSFSEELFSDAFSFEMLLNCQSKQTVLPPAERERVIALLELLRQETAGEERPFAPLYIRSVLNMVLIEILRREQSDGMMPGHTGLDGVLFYLQRHFREPITVHSAARQANLSPDYFGKLFRQVTGVGLPEYLGRLRLRYAARLLQSTDDAVTEVCYRSGFNSFSSFSRAFLREYKTTPTRYRQDSRKADGKGE